MRVGAFLALWLIAPALYAASSASSGLSEAQRRDAAERFDRAMAFLERGEMRSALAELDHLYSRTRHPQVLYNLALLYARMKRPVEAVRAVDQLLAQPGQLSEQILAAARRIRQVQEKRVAQLSIGSNVPALIEIEGLEAGRTPMAQPLAVASGRWVVTISSPGYITVRKEVTIAGQQTLRLHVDLLPADRRMAQLKVHTPVPAASVIVDGQRVGKSPLPGMIAVQPGQRVIEVRRVGYQSMRRKVMLAGGATASLSFDLEEDRDSDAVGRLLVHLSEGDADLFIDGQPRRSEQGALRLPAGPHYLRVERTGFLTGRRVVHVPRGGQSEVRMALVPTAQTRKAYSRGVRRQRVAGWASLISGAALALGAGAWWLLNKGQLDDARSAQSAAAAILQAGPLCGPGADRTTPAYAQCVADLRQADDEVNRHKNLRTASLVGLGVGAAAAVAGAVLLATADDPRRYDERPARQRYRWQLSGLVDPEGGRLQLSGSF